MHEVKLLSFPHPRHERIERVVHKHNARMAHPERAALVHAVETGRPQVVARYAEEHAAQNCAIELRLLDAVVEVAAAGAGVA